MIFSGQVGEKLGIVGVGAVVEVGAAVTVGVVQAPIGPALRASQVPPLLVEAVISV